MLTKIPILLSFLFASATPSQPLSTSLIEPIIQALREDGSQSSRAFSGGVLIDVPSFVRSLRNLDTAASERAVAAHFKATEKSASKDEAVVCGLRYGHKNCSIADDAVFISLRSVSKKGDAVVVTASVKWSDRRKSGASAIGEHVIRLTFNQVDGKWVLTRKDIQQTT